MLGRLGIVTRRVVRHFVVRDGTVVRYDWTGWGKDEVDPIVKTQDRGFLSYTLLLPTDYSNMIAGNSMPLLA